MSGWSWSSCGGQRLICRWLRLDWFAQDWVFGLVYGDGALAICLCPLRFVIFFDGEADL